eukprot:Sspe_Gene.7793::Locus_2640_Transcript_1_1_Confidence_1.000_Length_1885::g.7793::m.7793
MAGANEQVAQEVSRVVERVAAKGTEWAKLPDKLKLEYLIDARERVDEVFEEWGKACNESRGYLPYPHLHGVGFLLGPGMTGTYLNALIRTYESLVATGKPPPPASTRKVGEQIVAKVFPLTFTEKISIPSVSEVWLEPGKPATQGACRARTGTCAILSAGNFECPNDVLSKMFVESKVVVYSRHANLEKSNRFIERIFKKLVDDGFFAVLPPGIPMADALVRHSRVDEVLMTGGCATYDKIVWGNDEAKAKRVRRIEKQVDAELGAVSPYIIVPGDWSAKEIEHHARALVGFKLMNSGAICASPQLVVMQKGWKHRDAFIAAVKKTISEAKAQPVFYPGTQDRCEAAKKAYPGHTEIEMEGGLKPVIIEGLTEADIGSFSTRNEAFAPVLVELQVEAPNAMAFLEKTRDIVNSDSVFGSLSCSVIIRPSTLKEVGEAYFNNWMSTMQWGTTAVNDWGGMGPIMPCALWGAYPKHTPEDIQSGQGIVGNALMFDYPQKQVLTSPFLAPVHPKGGPTSAQAALHHNLASYSVYPSCWRLTKLAFSAVRAML